jgi:hypothetical protein
MKEKWIGAIVLVIACVGLGAVALVSTWQGFRRGEFHNRSTWFPRSQDKTFFHIVISLMGLGGLALIIFGLIFGYRILFDSDNS